MSTIRFSDALAQIIARRRLLAQAGVVGLYVIDPADAHWDRIYVEADKDKPQSEINGDYICGILSSLLDQDIDIAFCDQPPSPPDGAVVHTLLRAQDGKMQTPREALKEFAGDIISSLETCGFRNVRVVYSLARGIDDIETEVNLLVDADRGTGLLELVKAKRFCTRILCCAVTIDTKFHPAMGEPIPLFDWSAK